MNNFFENLEQLFDSFQLKLDLPIWGKYFQIFYYYIFYPE